MPSRRMPLALLAAVALVAACSGPAAPDATLESGDALSGTVTVFAAASLADSFSAVGAAFEAAHPGVAVRFSFAGSSELAAQVAQGAPVDVLATADAASMDTALGGLVEAPSAGPSTFATNVLQIAVAGGNPEGVTELADLADPALLVVLCAPEVPCGRYSAEVLDRAGVMLAPVSLEQSVKGVVNKVLLGEADAGIVYRTDIAPAGELVGIDIPPAQNVVAEYPIAALSSPLGAAFVAFVLGAEGQSILRSFGFGGP